ncbi:hypothetical protein DQ04_02361070 [Trypanosoma grayi]|uniref:hypothetical protein n=1 Tax=Trypanosoma grayi TaxID=71804 RepID=UPI0004F3EFF9|nr:hypothetical protein DQ04_02361070 [Trypanosoma grayi]KEG11695.1 hypothetical protein DQ04_02361070 [Trypanosoma grayi]
MAKDTLKKNVRRNETRMRIFTIAVFVINAVSIIAIMYYRGSVPHLVDIAGVTFWAGQEYMALALLKRFAKPTYSSTGELLDCPDASNPAELGVYSFAQDVLWVCCAVQLLCSLFHWAFVIFYLPVPAMAMYKLWHLLAPLLLLRRGASAVGEGDEDSALPRDRMERRRMELMQRKKRSTK